MKMSHFPLTININNCVETVDNFKATGMMFIIETHATNISSESNVKTGKM